MYEYNTGMIYLINSPSGDQYGVQGFKAQIPGYNDLEFEPIQVLGEGLYNSTTGSNITDSKDFAKYLYTVLLTNENKDEPTYDELKQLHQRSHKVRDTLYAEYRNRESDTELKKLMEEDLLNSARVVEPAWLEYERQRLPKNKKEFIKAFHTMNAVIKKVQARLEEVPKIFETPPHSRRNSVDKEPDMNTDDVNIQAIYRQNRKQKNKATKSQAAKSRGRGGKKRPVRARATNQGDDDDEDNIAEMLLNGSISKFEMNILHIKNGKASRSIIAVQANPATGALKFTEKSKTPVKIVP